MRRTLDSGYLQETLPTKKNDHPSKNLLTNTLNLVIQCLKEKNMQLEYLTDDFMKYKRQITSLKAFSKFLSASQIKGKKPSNLQQLVMQLRQSKHLFSRLICRSRMSLESKILYLPYLGVIYNGLQTGEILSWQVNHSRQKEGEAEQESPVINRIKQKPAKKGQFKSRKYKSCTKGPIEQHSTRQHNLPVETNHEQLPKLVLTEQPLIEKILDIQEIEKEINFNGRIDNNLCQQRECSDFGVIDKLDEFGLRPGLQLQSWMDYSYSALFQMETSQQAKLLPKSYEQEMEDPPFLPSDQFGDDL